jgi:hypothetical protein
VLRHDSLVGRKWRVIPRRVGLILAVVATTAITPACHGDSTSEASRAPTRHFQDEALALAFDYPTAWEHGVADSGSTVYTGYYLSSAALDPACNSTSDSTSQADSCGPPLVVLEPGSVLVAWRLYSHPFADDPIPNTTVANQPASVVVERPGSCGQLGADETITVSFPRANHYRYEMKACLRAPGVEANEALVHDMLASTVFGL